MGGAEVTASGKIAGNIPLETNTTHKCENRNDPTARRQTADTDEEQHKQKVKILYLCLNSDTSL